MQNAIPYTLTNESVTVIWEGRPHVVQKGSTNFLPLRTAILNEDWQAIPKNLTQALSLKAWAKGKFSLDGGNTLSYDGRQVPSDFNKRIIEMATAGENPSALFNFWEKLQRNPSMRSVQQLWTFLQHEGIPLTSDGCFLAYKGVRQDYKDQHSGTCDNSPGAVHEMPRNQISDDPNEACHVGFHVGALEYARTFAARVVICKVDPENVVCVPYDANAQKMRVCKYEVIGNYGSQLPSTTFKEEVDEEDDEYYVTTYPQNQVAPTPEEETQKPLSKMSGSELFGQSTEELRKYAAKTLQIVGASRIPGGKTSLIARIMEVRGY